MRCRIELTVLWHDDDVLKIRMFANNERFCGTADLYVGVGCLGEAAATLDGFPCSATDSRVLLFGEFGSQYAGGAASIRLSTEGGAIRCFVDCRIESEYTNEGLAESAHFYALVEPAAIDSFVSELRIIEAKKAGTATLATAVMV